jgi:hypothetical protein
MPVPYRCQSWGSEAMLPDSIAANASLFTCGGQYVSAGGGDVGVNPIAAQNHVELVLNQVNAWNSDQD